MKMKVALAAAIALALLAVIGAVVVGALTFDGLVTEDPYETGLHWDEIRRQKAELGWTPKLDRVRYAVGRNQINFTLKDASGSPVPIESFIVETGRTDNSGFDRPAESCHAEDHLYTCNVSFLSIGRWEIRFRWARNPGQISFVQRVDVVESYDTRAR